MAEPTILQATARGLCPKCGAPTLFAGPLRFARKCESCGLDFETFNVGDGPAAFLTLIIGAVTVALALWLDFSVHPPLWVHALLWIPFTTIAVIGGLRFAKAWLLASEYANKAREAGANDFEN